MRKLTNVGISPVIKHLAPCAFKVPFMKFFLTIKKFYPYDTT